MGSEIKKSNMAGWWISGVTFIAFIGAFLNVYPAETGGPMGEMAYGITIAYTSVIIFIVTLVSISSLIAFSCRPRFYFITAVLLGVWLIAFVPLFIPKTHYWGIVSVQNDSRESIFIENVGEIGPGSNVGFSGLNFGNSSDSISLIWWYGNYNRPINETKVVHSKLQCPPNLKRKSGLLLTIDEAGNWTVKGN